MDLLTSPGSASDVRTVLPDHLDGSFVQFSKFSPFKSFYLIVTHFPILYSCDKI